MRSAAGVFAVWGLAASALVVGGLEAWRSPGSGEGPARAQQAEVREVAAPEGGCGASDAAAPEAPRSFAEAPGPGTLAHCVVMNRTFRVDEATVVHEHEGRFYAFCCETCRQAFLEDPARYLAHDA